MCGGPPSASRISKNLNGVPTPVWTSYQKSPPSFQTYYQSTQLLSPSVAIPNELVLRCSLPGSTLLFCFSALHITHHVPVLLVHNIIIKSVCIFGYYPYKTWTSHRNKRTRGIKQDSEFTYIWWEGRRHVLREYNEIKEKKLELSCAMLRAQFSSKLGSQYLMANSVQFNSKIVIMYHLWTSLPRKLFSCI